jgi:hypothetical protein
MSFRSQPKLSGSLSDSWLTPIRFAFILAILIASFFPDVLFAGKSFFFRDFGIFTYPAAYFQRESFWHGQIPLWNPLNNCGIPFLAQWNTVVLYPLSLIYILLPLTWGLTLYFLAHLFLAGFGMYLLASQWTGNRLAAAIAGVAFVFNGLTLNCLMWASNLAALAWMPWVILAAEQAWQLGGKRVILAALAGAVQMLAGAPEIVVFTWLIIFTICIGQAIAAIKFHGRTFTRLFLVVLIVSLLSAAQFLPFMDLLAHSERNSALGASFWAIPISGWANLLVPLFHSYRSPMGVYFQPWQDWTSSYYICIGVLALALLAIILVRTPRVWLLAGFAIFGFVVALGNQGEVYPLLLKIFPPLGFMRYPIKFAFLTVFAVPLLAAFGVAWFRTIGITQSSTALRWTLCVMILLISMIGGIIWYAHVYPFPTDRWPFLLQNGLFRAVFLVFIPGTILIYGRIRSLRLQIFTGLLLLILIWLDIATFAPRQNPTVEASAYQSGLLAQRMNPLPQIGEARAFMTKQTHDFFYGSMLSDSYKDYVGRRIALFGNCNLLDNIPTADGFYSLYVREQRNLFLHFFFSPTNAFPQGLADFLGISQMSDPEKLLGWQSRPSHLPFCTIGPKPIFVALSNAPALLLGSDFDPSRVVYLPQESKKSMDVTNQVHGIILAAHFTPQRLDFETEAEAPTLLVLSQTYYHPWHAYVNDQPVKIWRANYAFQAIEIPQGRSMVKFIYEDSLFNYGATISCATFLACMLILIRKRIPKPKLNDENS